MRFEIKFTGRALKTYVKLPHNVRNKLDEKLSKLAIDPYNSALDAKNYKVLKTAIELGLVITDLYIKLIKE
jgi:mRNA-degrading endonuclease RelE of RelBE toxin-antitoxin system